VTQLYVPKDPHHAPGPSRSPPASGGSGTRWIKPGRLAIETTDITINWSLIEKSTVNVLYAQQYKSPSSCSSSESDTCRCETLQRQNQQPVSFTGTRHHYCHVQNNWELGKIRSQIMTSVIFWSESRSIRKRPEFPSSNSEWNDRSKKKNLNRNSFLSEFPVVFELTEV
jgi:hypothetical protein